MEEHKATSVVVAAYELAGPGLRRQLVRTDGARRTSTTPAIERWRNLIVASGAVRRIEELIDDRHSRALRAHRGRRHPGGPARGPGRHGRGCTTAGGLMRTVGGHEPTGRRRRRRGPVRAVGCAAAGRPRPQGHRRSNAASIPAAGSGVLDIGGYRLDTGPTVLTMPDIIDDAFAAVGESLADRLDLDPVHPAYRAAVRRRQRAGRAHRRRRRWRPRSSASPGRGGRRLPAAARLADQAVPRGVRRLHRRQLRLAAVAARPRSSPGWPRSAGFGAGSRMVRRFLHDERLRRVFTFQALYAGVPPQPRARRLRRHRLHGHRGRGVVPARRHAGAARRDGRAPPTDAGVEFRYGATVTALERSGSRVTAVRTAEGGRIACRRGGADHRPARRLSAAGPHPAPAVAAAALAVGRGRCTSGCRAAAGRGWRTTRSSSAPPGGRRSARSPTTGG